ncbi:hypothetical protein LIER_15109 [Lithospermum erythrorhizon]|uniref:Uncharacterized protein n=1 Tax=Lithospermum erythrorhizon TaxID=34254 RepID=A0AAV3Q3I1_LITER
MAPPSTSKLGVSTSSKSQLNPPEIRVHPSDRAPHHKSKDGQGARPSVKGLANQLGKEGRIPLADNGTNKLN